MCGGDELAWHKLDVLGDWLKVFRLWLPAAKVRIVLNRSNCRFPFLTAPAASDTDLGISFFNVER